LRRKGGFLAKAGAFSTNQLACGVAALLKTRPKKARIRQEKSRMEWEAMADDKKGIRGRDARGEFSAWLDVSSHREEISWNSNAPWRDMTQRLPCPSPEDARSHVAAVQGRLSNNGGLGKEAAAGEILQAAGEEGSVVEKRWKMERSGERSARSGRIESGRVILAERVSRAA
jgi:hypothetical protein